MPNINFDEVPDANFTPVPAGKYPVQVTKIVPGVSTKGDEMWTLEMTITSGVYAAKKIIDRLTFSEGGVARVKIAYKAMGLPTSGRHSCVPADLLDGTCVVDVTIEETTSRKPGQEPKTYKNNKVVFDGYYKATDQADPPPDEEDDDLPF